MVKVSICIPAYKEVSFLRRCLNSIMTQTFKDFEVIVSDDSPSNEIEELVKEYAYLPIIYHKNPQALGSPENWNKAISMASGIYIKVMHYDDWFSEPTSLWKMVDALDNNSNASFVFCAFREVGTNKTIHRHPNSFELSHLRKNPDILGLGNLIGPPSVAMYCNFENFFFDKNLIWLVDIEQYIRFLRKYPDFIYISEELVCSGNSDEQITQKCINDHQLINRETAYMNNKLNLKYNKTYLYYHTFKNVFIPNIKKILGIKRRLL